MADDIENLSGSLDSSKKSSPVSSAVDLKKSFPQLLSMSSPVTREWIQQKRQRIRPWGTFVSTAKFRTPVSPLQVSQRIVQNLDHFQSNYFFVFVGLLIYCLLTSPLLLVAVAASGGACYIIRLKNAERKIKILGHELTSFQQYGLVLLCSIPVFCLAGAGSAVFWIIGASFFLIVLHATFFAIETLNVAGDESFKLQMENV